MRDRLASLSDEARSIRAQVPHEFEPDVERIQQQMQRLGERLSVLSGGQGHDLSGGEAGAGSQAAPEDVILLGAPSKTDDPWDEQSANALTRFYESGEPFAPAAQTAGLAASAASAGEPQNKNLSIEPEWLNERFADIAQRIEQSLAEIRPESSLLTLGRRFDQLEERMTSALRSVTRADLGELRGAETQIEEINTQLDQFRRQLARLDAIDAHLGTLAAQLSDERLGRLFNQGSGQGSGMGGADASRLEAIDAQLGTLAAQLSHEHLADLIGQGAVRSADLKEWADATAQKVVARLADQDLAAAPPRDLGEVRGMLESFINERRHSDENNASMLETMQQAIIRVLDRIDALELGQQHAGESAPPSYMPPMAQSRPDAGHASHDFQRSQTESHYEAPHAASYGGETDEESFVPDEPQVGYATAPFDLDAAFASERDTGPERFGTPEPPARAMDVLRHDFIADAHRAKLKAASKLEGPGDLGQARMGEGVPAKEKAPPKKARARRSIFNFRSPRVLMCILTLLAMIPAALFFMPRTPADGATTSSAKSALPLSHDGVSGAGGAAAGNGASGLPANGMPATRSRQLVPGSDPEAGQFEDIGAPDSNGRYDRVDTAAIPEVLAAASDRHTIVPSGGMSATPAALMQERVLRMNGVVPTAGVEGSGEAKAPGLPPAAVGPFSLRMAAAQGNPSAQFEVATRLAEGKGTDQDLKAATQWYLRSATSGFAMAQFRLGTLYERGVSVKTDLARAKVWYARAAEQGNVKAMHNLAVLIAGRGGVEPDYTTAAKWFGEAASRGLADSQYNLAVLYENGLGVAKDDKQAYKWLLLAAKSGDSEAQSRRDALKARLSEGVRSAAEAMAQSWLVKPADPMANDSRVAGQAWKQGPQRVTRR